MGPRETFRGDPYVHCHNFGYGINYIYVKTLYFKMCSLIYLNKSVKYTYKNNTCPVYTTRQL